MSRYSYTAASWNERFGLIRNLLQEKLEGEQLKKLKMQLDILYAQNRERCLQEVCPYILSYFERLDKKPARFQVRPQHITWHRGLLDYVSVITTNISELVQTSQQESLADFALALNLSSATISTRDLHILANSGAACRVRELELHYCRCDVASLVRMFQEPWSLLRTLTIQRLEFDFDSFEQIITSSRMPRLTHATINGCFQTSHGVLSLVSSPFLEHVTSLNLSWSRINSDAIQTFSQSPYLSSLRHLNLTLNQIQAPGVLAMCEASLVRRLEVLELRSNNISDEGVRHLTSSNQLGNLRVLDLGRNSIRDEGATLLAGYQGFRDDIELKLDGNVIGYTGAAALSMSPHLPQEVTAQW